jgi:hypothetical protein
MMAMAPGVHGFPHLIGSFENSTPRGAGLAETGEILRARSEHVACVGMLHMLPLRFFFDLWYSSCSTAEAVPRRLCSGAAAARACTYWISVMHMG